MRTPELKMEETQRLIIPTRSKAKISALLSFPIGAEKVSSALASTPQIRELVLHFHSDRWGLVRSGRYACIRISHSSRRANMSSKTLDESGVALFSEWEIGVYPIPKIYRSRIREYIVDIALPIMDEWLQSRSTSEQVGEQSLTFFFDEHQDVFTQETEEQNQPRRA